MVERVPGEDPDQVGRGQRPEVGVRQSQGLTLWMYTATRFQLGGPALKPAQRFFSRGGRKVGPDLARRAHTSRKMPGLQKFRENRAAKQEPFPRRQPKLHSRSLIQFAFYGLDREAEMLGDLCGRPLPF